MSGKRYILDTNAIIFLLKGNKTLLNLTEKADWLGISIISKIEFLAFPALNKSDADLFEEFVARINVIDLTNSDEELIPHIIETRKKHKKVKLPDAIVIATAIANNCTLITGDKQLHKVDEVEILSFDL
jgi:predicted nucleic acid-binding protein